MKIEVYYNKPEDAVIIVKDGIALSNNDSVNHSGYLDQFGINKVQEFGNLTGTEILENIKCILDDFECFFTEEEVTEYFEYVRNSEITGELITCKYID